MYSKILVPVDGSATSDRGFAEALQLAKAVGATVTIVHVVDAYPMVAGMEWATADTWQQLSDGLHSRGQGIVDAAHRTAVANGVTAETRLVEGRDGRVADEIVNLARSVPCDLIVMGTHGRRGFSHMALGSDAERVTRSSPVPVLLVRQPDATSADSAPKTA